MSACNSTAVATARPFASLDEVSVPDGMAPGSKFTVLLTSKQKNKSGIDRKECWAGSGPAPVIVPNQSQVVAGKRHALRPSARAEASRKAIDK